MFLTTDIHKIRNLRQGFWHCMVLNEKTTHLKSMIVHSSSSRGPKQVHWEDGVGLKTHVTWGRLVWFTHYCCCVFVVLHQTVDVFIVEGLGREVFCTRKTSLPSLGTTFMVTWGVCVCGKLKCTGVTWCCQLCCCRTDHVHSSLRLLFLPHFCVQSSLRLQDRRLLVSSFRRPKITWTRSRDTVDSDLQSLTVFRVTLLLLYSDLTKQPGREIWPLDSVDDPDTSSVYDVSVSPHGIGWNYASELGLVSVFIVSDCF